MGASVSPVEQILKNYQSLSCDSLPYNMFPFIKTQNGLDVGLSTYELGRWKNHI